MTRIEVNLPVDRVDELKKLTGIQSTTDLIKFAMATLEICADELKQGGTIVFCHANGVKEELPLKQLLGEFFS
jgi:hypothetical protein